MKYAFVSGAMGGLAQIALRELTAQDYTIFAGDVLIDRPYIHKNIHYLPLDLTKESSFDQTKEYISRHTSTLDIVANFAGTIVMGSTVETAFLKIDHCFQVNILGMIKLNATLFSFVKSAKGRYINISSEYARLLSLPFHSLYTMNKHAVDVYTNGLRRELYHFGISVVGIRPGAFQTNMTFQIENAFEKLVQESVYFKDILIQLKDMMESELAHAKSTKLFVRTFKKAAFTRKPRRFYNINRSLKMRLLSKLPVCLQDFVLSLVFKSK